MKKIILLTLIGLSVFSCKEKESELSDSNNNIESVEDTISTEAKQRFLVSKIYQSCGKIDLANKTIEVETYLPPLKEGSTYKYIKYYNISNDKYFGVLGVLEIVDGRNIDLNSHPNSANSRYTRVDKNTIDLDKLKNFNNAGLAFDSLTEKDSITFICFHDDTFTTDNINDKILKFYQDRLPNVEVYRDSSNTKSFPEPMIGNGGILTVIGCK